MRAFVLLLLAPALLLGCRDAVVDAPPGAGAPPEGPPHATEDLSQFYVKGPRTLAVGDESLYRAEAVSGATSYRWRVAGSLDVLSGTVEEISGLNRLLRVRALKRGRVTIVVHAHDEAEQMLAVSYKDVEVR